MSTQNQENNEMKTVSWEESGMVDLIEFPDEVYEAMCPNGGEELIEEEEAEADYKSPLSKRHSLMP